ncbi:MAG: hypothetical protein ACPGSM_09635 [Thiolinea sp.]
MNLNPSSVPERVFKRPLSWASLDQLEFMRDEMTVELEKVHSSVRSEAAKRNGFFDVDKEIQWRMK